MQDRDVRAAPLERGLDKLFAPGPAGPASLVLRGVLQREDDAAFEVTSFDYAAGRWGEAGDATVTVSAAASFLTPVATPANLMVMEPGGYRFGDYWKLGLPLPQVREHRHDRGTHNAR